MTNTETEGVTTMKLFHIKSIGTMEDMIEDDVLLRFTRSEECRMYLEAQAA